MPFDFGFGKRVSPKAKAGVRTNVAAYVDTTGMDPEMKTSISQEVGRRDTAAKAFGPYGAGASKVSNWWDSLFGKKKK